MNLTKVLYFTTSTVIDWVDIFTRPSYRHIIVDSLSYCQTHKGLIIYAWVLMSNHLHMIVDTNDDTTVSDVLRDFKKFTNKKILKALEQEMPMILMGDNDHIAIRPLTADDLIS